MGHKGYSCTMYDSMYVVIISIDYVKIKSNRARARAFWTSRAKVDSGSKLKRSTKTSFGLVTELISLRGIVEVPAEPMLQHDLQFTLEAFKERLSEQ